MGRHPSTEDKKGMKGPKDGLGVAHKNGQKKKKKTVSVKGQMRSLQRLLNKQQSLPPKVQRTEEQKMEALRQKHEQQKQNERDRQLAKRYHMAKFFERIKIERMVEKAKREMAKAGEDVGAKTAAAEKLARAQEDLQYVMHFPKGEKFVSLLKSAATPEAQAQLDAERARLRGLVRRQVADDVLLSEANEGRKDAPSAQTQDTAAKAAAEQAPLPKQALTGNGKERSAVLAKAKKTPSRAVEAAMAVAPRAAEGNMAAEDDFFMQIGDESTAPGKTQPAQAQARAEVRQSLGSGIAARSKKSESRSKYRPEINPSGPPLPRVVQRVAHNCTKTVVESQADKAPTRSRAEGGRKRRKKAK